MATGRWLRAARRSRRLSQRELAALAEVPLSTISRIEAGRTTPRLDTFVQLLASVGYELVIVDHRLRMLTLDPVPEFTFDPRPPPNLQIGEKPTTRRQWFRFGQRVWDDAT